ncbi:MAG TPA: hypothetical protein VKT82_05170 [Ktedonobacterales bacterium]|nr:hypothetical protein [Ktedonobacterales bacterium]
MTWPALIEISRRLASNSDPELVKVRERAAIAERARERVPEESAPAQVGLRVVLAPATTKSGHSKLHNVVIG